MTAGPVRAAHERLCARHPRYAEKAQLLEWHTTDGELVQFVALKGSASRAQIDWLRAALDGELRHRD